VVAATNIKLCCMVEAEAAPRASEDSLVSMTTKGHFLGSPTRSACRFVLEG
jgi:hypothetical protein